MTQIQAIALSERSVFLKLVTAVLAVALILSLLPIYNAQAAVPTFSGVTVSNIVGTGAQINWTTNEPAKYPWVMYGTSAGSYPYNTNASCSNDITLLYSNHCVYLTGLTPSTVYHYAVKSSDSAGLQGTSGDFTFTSASSVSSAPATPSSLRQTGSTSNSITLAWNDNSSNEDKFMLERKLSSSSSYSFIYQAGTNIATYTDTSVASGSTYDYRIQACREGYGCSDYTYVYGVSPSSSSSDTTAPSVPPAPTLNIVSSSQINLSWTASTDNVGVTGYKIYRCVCGNTSSMTYLGSVTGLTYSDTGLSGSTSYTYAIAAYDAAGNVSNQGPGATGTTFAGSGSGSNTPPVPSVPSPASYSGAVGTYYTYSTTLYPDPDGNQVKAIFDWGDGTTTETGLVTINSGGTSSPSATHAWSTSNLYSVRAKAVDSTGLSSAWSSAASMTVGVPPASASNLTATNSSGNVVLNWTDNSTTETGFKLYRGPTWTDIGNVGANVTTYTVTGLAAGTTYTFKVQAFTNCCSSTYPIYSNPSNEVSITTPGTGDTTVPSTPPVPALSIVSSSQINLSWGASTDNVGVTGYKIYRCVCGNTSSMVYLTSVSGTTYSNTGLSGSTTYTYAISAYDAAGNNSSQGPAASGTTFSSATVDTTAPSVPTNLAISATTNNQLNLSWTASTDNIGVAGYKIYRNGNYINMVTALNFTDTGLTASTNYSYYIAAVDGASNQSGFSTTVSMTTLSGTTADVTAPVITSGSVRVENIINSGAQIKWSTNENATSRVEYGTTSGSLNLNVEGDCFGTGLRIDHCVNLTGLTSGVRYYYKVKSTDGVGLSIYSSEYSFIAGDSSSATTPPPSTSGSPNAPTALVMDPVPTATAIYLKWTDNSGDETKFAVERTLTGTGGWTFLGFVGSNVTNYTDGSITAGTFYDYRVQACRDGYGCSGYIYLYNVSNSGTAGNLNQPAPKLEGWGLSVGSNSTSTIGVTFNTEMDASTFTANNVFLYKATDSPNLPVPATLQKYNYTFTLVTNAALAAGQEYISVIKASVKNKAGVGLAADYTCRFTALSSGYYTGCPSGAVAFKSKLVGTITDSSGKAVAQVGVHVFTKDFSLSFGGSTSADGSFSISLPPAAYMMELYPPYERKDLIKPSASAVEVKDGEIKRVNFQFSSVTTVSKIITGTIKFSNGQPVTDAQVGAYNETTNYWSDSPTDTFGNYKLLVSAGKYKVSFRPKDPAVAKWQWSGSFQDVEFTGDASETKTLSFTVPAFDTKLIITVVDDKGAILPNAGIMLEQESSPAQYRRSEADGKATFLVIPGKYILRGYMPIEQGWVNPSPLAIDVVSGSKEVTLKFAKLTAESGAAISGKVYLDNGKPASEAFIWAWSEQGGNAYGRTNAMGEFSMTVPHAGVYRLGAGKEVDGFPYKSAEITIHTDYDAGSISLILIKYSATALPKPVEVVKAVTETIIAQAEDGAQVVIPPSAAGSSGTVNIQMAPTVEVASQEGAKIVGTVWDVGVTNQSGSAITKFAGNIEITFPYDEEKLKVDGVSADVLKPNYYDEATGAWVEITDYTVDKDSKSFILRVNHLTRFALVAPADTTAPAVPSAISYQLGAKDVTLTWVNPAADFHHARVYRTEKASEPGELLADLITTGIYKDSSVVAGKTYYYYLAAMDASGNSSDYSALIKVTVTGQGSAPSVPVGSAVSADKYPSGLIFKYASDATVYILENGTKRPITDISVLRNRVPANRAIVTMPSSVTFPTGDHMTLRSGTLIKGKSDDTVYLTINGNRRAFSSAEEFLKLGYRFSQVQAIDDNAVKVLPESAAAFTRPSGTLFKYAKSSTLYYLDNGAKRSFSSMAVFKAWNDSLNNVITIPDSETYPDGATLGFPNGILVKGPGAAIYLVFDGKLRPLGSASVLSSLGFNSRQVLKVSSSDLKLHATGEAIK